MPTLTLKPRISTSSEIEVLLRIHNQELEKRLAQHTERLELALEASKMGTWEWNIETGELIWSPEMKGLYGMEPGTNVTVDKFFAALHPDDREMKKQVLGSAVQSGLPYAIEHRCVWADGSVHWIMGRGKAYTKNGKAYRMVGTAMNVDERKELVRLNKAKDEFIALASHQLRTPATGVKQFVGMMLEGYAGDLTNEQETMLRHAYESNERQIRIIDSLLLVARVDAGKVVFTRKACDIVQLVHDVIDEQKIEFNKRQQKIIFEFPKALKAIIDPRYIRMVLENIISNAGKYSPVGKSIQINAKRSGQQVVISIHDKGVGISKADQQKLYQKFIRIDNPLSTAAGGNGLGLYWSKKIIDAHGGTIELESRPRRGTTFTIKLPL